MAGNHLHLSEINLAGNLSMSLTFIYERGSWNETKTHFNCYHVKLFIIKEDFLKKLSIFRDAFFTAKTKRRVTSA